MRLIYKGNFEPPEYQTSRSAGFDLRSECLVFISAGGRAVVPTGCYLDTVNINQEAYLRIAPRSGLAFSAGLDVLAGVVDPDYEGEIKVILQNLSDKDITIQPGVRIAQGIVTKTERMVDVPVKRVVRGPSGFGSSGAV